MQRIQGPPLFPLLLPRAQRHLAPLPPSPRRTEKLPQVVKLGLVMPPNAENECSSY
ncbi:hypothetical protein M431DRAFT_503500 [Trichoderma harzianum CBS 226.95]|uniref:Uncharacterized protein n=1 Tax=Trichoderma harzianum CBS 226.95 TaxID=983964 RepID=A0A2T4AN76_TRIHA|nr:hypothetical protein M431DRAFT_503500 [Trichoderma harzianum CBS 226.95]PTB58536.1 hypothetical protein M431DRAFT_503500 [Trichoderma harzianum CBS 226.95]